MTAAWRIGENTPRREDVPLLRGDAVFFADRPPPADCLHMAVVRSPVAHGCIDCIDVAAARRQIGVRLVLAAVDLARNGPLPAIDLAGDAALAFLPLLADGRVRYAGQPIAVVVADTLEQARDAAATLRPVIAPRAPLTSAAAALAGPPVHDAPDNAVNTVTNRVGNPDTEFANAHVVIEETFRFHRIAAIPMEPRAAEADFDAASGRLSISATTQIPMPLRDFIAAQLDLDKGAVEVAPLPLGGGFGCKENIYAEEALVAIAAARLVRPVRWQETRAEHFTATAHARQGEARLRLAFNADGEATALEIDGVSDIGAGYAFLSNTPGATIGGMGRGAYRIPHHQSRTRSVVTNKTPLNVYRGAGHPQAMFAIERMMDRAARHLGIDRVEIRRKNLIPRDAFPVDRGVSYPGAGRIVYDSGNYPECLDQALDAIGAESFPERRRAAAKVEPDIRLGLGFAMVVELTSTGPDETVALTVGEGGRITVATASVEIGQRAENALTQTLSSVTGLPAGSISVMAGGSGLSHSGGGTYASRGAAVVGAAVADAGERLKRAAITLCAERYGIPAADLRWEDGGMLVRRESNRTISLAELWSALDPDRRAELDVTGEFRVAAPSFASACHAAVVSVDIQTGMVSVLDYAAAHDCGRVLNPQGVDDQIVGGIMQGIGATLFEEILYSEDGIPLTRGLLDYTLPVAANVPAFHLRHVETPSPLNPLGFKGAGEAGFTGAPAALTSAIEDALSEFNLFLTDDGPYTPARVRALMRRPSLSVPSQQEGSAP